MRRRSRRPFTPPFKAKVILELRSEQRSSAELCAGSSSVVHSPDLEGHGLSGLPSLFQSEQKRGPEQSYIAELEQLVGRQTLDLADLKQKPAGGSLGPRVSENVIKPGRPDYGVCTA